MRRNMNGNPNFSRTPMREECSPSKPRDPHRFARSEERMCGVFHRVFVLREDLRKNLLFPFSFKEEELSGIFENRKCDSDAIFDREMIRLSVNHAFFLLQYRINVARKERRDMPILAKPERHYIDRCVTLSSPAAAGRIEARCAIYDLPNPKIIVFDAFLKIERGIWKDDLRLWNRCVFEECFPNHLLITFLVIIRNESLINEKNRDLVPLDCFEFPEGFVDWSRCRSSRKPDRTFPLVFDCIQNRLFEFGGGTVNELGFGIDRDVTVIERHSGRIP